MSKLTNAQQYEKAMEYLHTINPPPFNPSYDPNSKIWWSPYCAKIRAELIRVYKELYPDGEVDGEHFNEVRQAILKIYIEPLRNKMLEDTKIELNLKNKN